MKIIAKTGDSGFLIEAHVNELAQLCGFASAYDYNQQRSFQIGQMITVHAMFKRLYTLEQRKGELSRIAKQLRAQADLMESVEPVIEAATTEGASS